MRYTGEKCPYCGEEFTAQDDVVVCPDCGTPHHRGCWFVHGECANADKHAEGYVWSKAVKPEPAAKEPEAEEKTQPKDNESLDVICPDCGESCPNGTLRCPKCGAMFIPFVNQMGAGAPPIAQFKVGFDSNEDINGLKSGDIALFCRTAGASYIKKFRKKCSWNWAAFWFAPYWFFYRKLYKVGMLFFAAFISFSLLAAPAQQYLETHYSAFVTEREQYIAQRKEAAPSNGTLEYLVPMDTYYETEFLTEKLSGNPMGFIKSSFVPLLLDYGFMFLMTGLQILAALTADRLYFKKACTEIKRIRSSTTDERSVQVQLFRAGGTNILIGGASYFAYQSLLYAASYFMMR